MGEPYKLVLVRHGESEWNKANRFTGWKDVPLSEKGVHEAQLAGQTLLSLGYEFDMAYTSVLRRAIKTLWIILEETKQEFIPVIRDYRLNERHYGGLQGLNKAETAEKHGEKQVLIWRRSYDVPPPLLEEADERHPCHDRRYQGIPNLPSAESLKLTVERFIPYYEEEIVPQIKAGKRIIIAAHGNSLRALVKHLDGIADDEIVSLNIPTGIPLVYELDPSTLKPFKHYYLADEETVAAAQHAVASQGKAK